MNDTTDITALILAGGRGSRLQGADKGLIPVAGRALIEHLIERLRGQCGNIMISANRNIDRYQRYGYHVIPDRDGDYPGPLAGIYSAMEHLQHGLLLTVPCDCPLLPGDYSQRMLHAMTHNASARLAVAHDGKTIQPLFSLLSSSLRSDLQQYLHSGRRKVHDWIRQQTPLVVDFSDNETMFFNMNTAAEQQLLETMLLDSAQKQASPS